MIPYFELKTIRIGPVTIYAWGLMVAIGIVVATWLAAKLAKERGQDPEVIWSLGGWCAMAGFLGARLFYVFAYDPATYLANPIRVLILNDGGYASIGALIGGAIAGVLYLRWKKVDVRAYADTAIFGFPVGYAIGRIGCFLIHDHPGTATHFFLGVKYPDGVVRHDLGLYEAIQGAVLAILFFVLWKKKAKQGTYLMTFLLWYGFVRFFLDFLRATSGPIVDARYFGLTPAQYAAIAMFAWGLWLYTKRMKKVA
jgi:phosphatidylglycerol---prolipoprotein diacylglyceryl transferase